MSVSLAELREVLAYRLGDASGDIWELDELNSYIQDGYNELCIRTGCLFDMAALPDLTAFTCTAEFEKDYLEAGMPFFGVANFTAEFERDFIDNGIGPANHTAMFEFTEDFVTDPLPLGVVNLPEDFYETERATWNSKRLDTLNSRFFEERDSRYELTRGEVTAYTQDKDGLLKLRKYRVPSTGYTPMELDDEDEVWGVLVEISDLTDELAADAWGDFVSIPGQQVGGDLWGVATAVYSDTNMVKLEYKRRPYELSVYQDFEIPDRYTVYVRHYAQAAALRREGPGYAPDLADFYEARFEEGVQRMLKRRQGMAFQVSTVLGAGATDIRDDEGLARLPWHYGRVVRMGRY